LQSNQYSLQSSSCLDHPEPVEQEGLPAVRLIPDLSAQSPRRKDLLKVEAFRRDVIAVARLGCITGTKVAKGSGISSEPG